MRQVRLGLVVHNGHDHRHRETEISIVRLYLIALSVLLAATPVLAQKPTDRDNPEMNALFVEDQAVRQGVKPEQYADRAFVTRMIEGDRTRRLRARTMLDAGKLKTANDFYAAAFLFQHGNRPEDYLLANTLAVAAVARGKTEGRWIAAATLDRYLQATGKPQIYGTQYLSGTATGPTMDPYDRTLVPDTLRNVLGVPDIARQQERLAQMKADVPR